MARRSKYDLEERLLEYATQVIRIVESVIPSMAGRHIAGQLLRSGTSPLLNHGEAEGAESQKDFVHKLRVCLKELRESERALKLIRKVPLVKEPETVDPLLKETDELIRIFVSSIRTATGNTLREINKNPYTGRSDHSAFDVRRSMFDVLNMFQSNSAPEENL